MSEKGLPLKSDEGISVFSNRHLHIDCVISAGQGVDSLAVEVDEWVRKRFLPTVCSRVRSLALLLLAVVLLFLQHFANSGTMHTVS